jgi:hypothetical protein
MNKGNKKKRNSIPIEGSPNHSPLPWPMLPRYLCVGSCLLFP